MLRLLAMSPRRHLLGLLALMSGMGRNVPMSRASTNIKSFDLQEENPSEVHSVGDVFTIVLILAIAVGLFITLMMVVLFLLKVL